MSGLKKKIVTAAYMSVLFGCICMPSVALAKNPDDLDVGFDDSSDSITINSFKGFDVGNVANDPRIPIKRFINVVMGFLGMLAVLTILFGGFKWMTGGKNKENTEKATKLLINGVIGLIIIFSAWTLAWFIVNTIKVNVGS